MLTGSLSRHGDFMKLWAGQTVSELGSVVTRTAVPLVALLVLGAGPIEMAFLVVSASLAVLLVGFFAGAWVDRLRRRPLLIWADAIRAGLLLSIPIAYVAGVLRLEQLYVVVFLVGCMGSLFDAAYPAYVPSLVGLDRVVEGIASSRRALRSRRLVAQVWRVASCRRSGRRSRSWSTRCRSCSRRSRSSSSDGPSRLARLEPHRRESVRRSSRASN